MIRILTQNKMAVINFDNCKALSVGLDNDKPIIVVDDMIIGYYDTVEEAQQVIGWIIESINTNKDTTNNTLVIPQIDDVREENAENN